MKSLLFHASFLFFAGMIGLFSSLFFFQPILNAQHLIIPYSLEPFDICTKFPVFWHYAKLAYLCFSSISFMIIANSFYLILFRNLSFTQKEKPVFDTSHFMLSVGDSLDTKEPVFLPEKSLYQNILITGTTGSGKTSSAMYPFCKQLIEYHALDPQKKLGMLILDVKGNFYKQVLQFAKDAFRKEDIVLISLDSNTTYNPLDRPHLKASVLAERLKTILLLFSPNNSDSYWLDKSAQVLAECIKLCRLSHNGYVTFSELHKLIFVSSYYQETLQILKQKFQNGEFSQEQCFDLLSAIEFFENEFQNLDSRVLSILKSEISRMTSLFLSDYSIQKLFCPSQNEISFSGFSSVLQEGKIVVLNMNLAEYQHLSRFMAAYLKLDFQSEILATLSKGGPVRPTAFFCDEFHEYVTTTDASFFAQSREAKCINIVATQSYSSLLNTLKDPTCVRVLTQNLINKFWFRTDDTFTIEDIQKQLGKEEKEKTSYSISENAKETNYHYLTRRFHSNNSNLSESINTYTQNDFLYDSHFFTRELPTFTCLAFLSDGESILPPCKLQMKPHFQSILKERKFLL